MANSPDNFEYRDDSIVARLAVEVPSQALGDLDQVRERVAAIRVENEAAARAMGDWAGYLQSMPQIIEQANQSYRNMITSMERMSYIQNEMGGGQANVSISGAPSGGPRGGAAPYSTAAPAGYTDPFMGLPGQGMGMGMVGAQTYMQSMMMNDPRMFANMAAQRGYPVNPAQLGLVGGAVAAQQGAAPHTGGGMGQGAPPPGAMTPQATQATRISSAQPDPTNGGAPASSEPQRTPATPHPDTPAWQQTLNSVAATAGSVLNETRAGMSGRGGGLIAGGAAAMSAIGRIGGNAGGGGGDDGGGGGGGGTGGGSGSMGNWGKVAAGAGAAGVGLGLMTKGFGKIQDAGEQIQQYRNLGAESGGGAVEGAGFEIQARMMAMNPFITLDQSRSIMQTALKNGYTGKEFDTVTAMMADNLKEMNMSSADSMKAWMAIVEKGNGSVKEFFGAMDELKDLTRVDGNKMGQSQRNQQFSDLADRFSSLGATKSVVRSAMGGTEAWSDDRTMKDIGSDLMGNAFSNPMSAMMLASGSGITGISDPSEVMEAMEEKGVDPRASMDKMMRDLARQSTQPNNPRGSVSAFMGLLNSMGMNVTRQQAKKLYDSAMKGENRYSTGADIKEAQAKADPGTIGEQMGNTFGVLQAPLNVATAIGKGFVGNFSGAKDALGAAGRNFTDFTGQMGKYFTDADDVKTDIDQRVKEGGKATVAEAQAAKGGGGFVSTEGRVSGDIRITVDQNGQVRAPQTISLTGTQRAVNAGQGGGTLNNPGPGDNHQSTGFGR